MAFPRAAKLRGSRRYPQSMETQVTVFRSADESAQEDSQSIRNMLAKHGIPSTLLDDSAPGVPKGAWEVQVAEVDAPRADALVAANPPDDEFADVDASHDLDMVTVFEGAAGGTGEMESLSVRNLLESSGISVMMTGEGVLPNLSGDVRVPADRVEEARRLIAEALAAGPAAADAAEAAGELAAGPTQAEAREESEGGIPNSGRVA